MFFLTGKLGHGDTNRVYKPKVVEALQGMFIRKVCAGSQSSLALTSTGQVWRNIREEYHQTFSDSECISAFICCSGFPGVRVGLWCLSGLRLLRSHRPQTQADRGTGHHTRCRYLNRRQSLPGIVTWYNSTHTSYVYL